MNRVRLPPQSDGGKAATVRTRIGAQRCPEQCGKPRSQGALLDRDSGAVAACRPAGGLLRSSQDRSGLQSRESRWRQSRVAYLMPGADSNRKTLVFSQRRRVGRSKRRIRTFDNTIISRMLYPTELVSRWQSVTRLPLGTHLAISALVRQPGFREPGPLSDSPATGPRLHEGVRPLFFKRGLTPFA